MELDLSTLTIVILIVILISSFVMIILWLMNPSQRGLKAWALSATIGAFAFFALAFQSYIGNYAVFLNNTGILTSMLLLLEGILRFRDFGNESRRKYPLIFLFVLFTVISYFNRDYPMARYLFHDFSAIILLSLSSFFILYGSHGMEFLVHLIAAGAIFILVPIFTYRWYLAFSGEIEIRLIGSTEHPFMSILFLLVIPWAIGWTYGLSIALVYKVQQKLNIMATHDELTGLNNRRSFEETMKTFLNEGKSLGKNFYIFMLDLNGFKKINDQHGHALGDDILVLLAKSIQEFIGKDDYAVRLGGDEFVVLIRYQEKISIQTLINRLRETVEKKRMINGKQIQLRASIGTAVFPTDGTTLDELLLVADKGMYKDKEDRKLVSEII